MARQLSTLEDQELATCDMLAETWSQNGNPGSHLFTRTPKFLLPGSGVELRREVMLKNCSRVDVPAIKTSKFDTIDGGETAGGLVIRARQG